MVIVAETNFLGKLGQSILLDLKLRSNLWTLLLE